MPDFTVVDYGTDSSGRTIWMTRYMHDWWEYRVADLGFEPVIVQGAFMIRDGGGAHDSSGAHDEGGCIDVRTSDLTTVQIDALVRECRLHGGAAYRRDLTPLHGGMDAHCHITLGTDRPLSVMAQILWNSYLSGGDGLAAAAGRPEDAPDYEWRPNPLVTVPPKEEDDVPYTDWPKKDRVALARDVAAAVTDQVLNADMNAQEPQGSTDFQGVTLRQALKTIYRRVVK